MAEQQKAALPKLVTFKTQILSLSPCQNIQHNILKEKKEIQYTCTKQLLYLFMYYYFYTFYLKKKDFKRTLISYMFYLTRILLEPEVVSLCHIFWYILLADQLQVLILKSLKLIMDSSKMEGGSVHLRNSGG